MIFKCKKVENCFAQARTYEYELPVTGKQLIFMLEGFTVKENHKLRRPVFSAIKNQVEIKGILSSNIVKINYTAAGWEGEKIQMEKWLEEQPGEILGETRSICPKCLKVIPAWKKAGEKGVYLVKNCPAHGRFEALIWEGSLESYKSWGEHVQAADVILNVKAEEKGCPLDCGLCEKHERKGCCVLLEVTQRCNLKCPICFASAGDNVGEEISLEALKEQMDFLMEHGGPFNLQLSGGEPTMREDLPEIIRMGKEKGFSFFQLNTNGIRLSEEGYAEKLKQAGLSCVFLQFDSLRDSVYEALRGKKLLKEKLRAIDACKKAGLGVVLVPVLVPGVNEEELGDLVAFAKSRMPVIRGIHIQPLSYFGRCPKEEKGYRITIPRILRLLEEQTSGEIKAEDFTGGNATNPYCTFQSNYLKQEDGTLKPMAHGKARETETSAQARDAVARQWSGSCCNAETPERKGCCCGEGNRQLQLNTTSFDEFLRGLHENTLAISGMVFQDGYTLDLERLRRCYILEADNRYGMVPFCAYNLTSEDGRSLYR